MDRLVWLAQIVVRALWSPTVMGANGAVIDDAGRVLLVRHGYRRGWMLPGGAVERGEAPKAAAMREVAEEVGLSGGACVFFGLYTRRAGWADNVIALYRITGASVNFRPSWEIREIVWADPDSPPPGTTGATRRRLAELQGAEISPFW